MLIARLSRIYVYSYTIGTGYTTYIVFDYTRTYFDISMYRTVLEIEREKIYGLNPVRTVNRYVNVAPVSFDVTAPLYSLGHFQLFSIRSRTSWKITSINRRPSVLLKT